MDNVTLKNEAIAVHKRSGKTPFEIFNEHQKMLEILNMVHVSNPDNVLLRNLIYKIENGQTD